MAGSWLYFSPFAWLRAVRRVLISPSSPRSQGGHANWNVPPLSYLWIPHSVEDLGTWGNLVFLQAWGGDRKQEGGREEEVTVRGQG